MTDDNFRYFQERMRVFGYTAIDPAWDPTAQPYQGYFGGGRASAKTWAQHNINPDDPPGHRDYYSTRKWKADPGGEPYRVWPDGTIDLHPSQWRTEHAPS